MVNTCTDTEQAATKPVAVAPHNNNLTPFQYSFMYDAPGKGMPQFNPGGRPYTRLDAVTTGISICTGWLVVLVLIYLGISKYNGGPGILSLCIYLTVISIVGYLARKLISNYFMHAIRADLLIPKK